MKGGSGRKKSEPKHLQTPTQPQLLEETKEASPPQPANREEEQINSEIYTEEAAEVEEDEEEDDEEGDDDDDDEQRPKLAEGFFEIEAVRAKRTRKGQRQYLIKWRGWPDTANTWEPIHNLQSCSDIIQAFEQRSSRSYRKRKRKHNNLQTQSKKKQQRPTTSNSPSTDQPNDHTSLSNSDLPSPHPPHEGVETGKMAESTDHMEDKDTEYGGLQGLDNVNAAEHLLENGSKDIGDNNQPKQITEADAEADHEVLLQGMPSSNGLDPGKISIQVADTRSLEKDDVVDDQSKAETPIRCIGAKRRKSGSVKRIKQDQVSPALDEAQPSVPGAVDEPRIPSQAPNLGDEANLGNSANPSTIAQIIEPVGFSTSVFNDVTDVSLTFRAVRSDGQETEVDNNFLKVHNPLLLIKYYEQHLRYTPPT